MTKRSIDPYIVVCRDLHAAFGIFITLAQAVKIARKLNEIDTQGCTYMPVRVELGDNVEYIDTNMPDSPEDIDWGGGGYL